MSTLNLAQNLAVHGYDVVAYFSGVAAVGDPALSAEHNGAVYYFASQENKEQFEGNPAQFVPAYGGWCAYAMSEGKQFDIDPRSFKIVDGHLYLFYDGVGGRTIDVWNENEPTRMQQAEQIWRAILKKE